jgi:hypothetical protein
MNYLIIILLCLVVIIIAFKLWLWSGSITERKRGDKLVAKLISDGTKTISKAEQFKILDGKGSTIIEEILNTEIIDMYVYDFFIDIEPDEYLEHLKLNNQEKFIGLDTYGEMEISHNNDIHMIKFYDHGNLIESMKFDDYEALLKFLVYFRLTNVSPKYKKIISKDYYLI